MNNTFPKDIMDRMKDCILSIFWAKRDIVDFFCASNSLYQFAKKTDGKMYGRGFFISVNGFSSDSVKALVVGKAINTMLVDGEDLVLITEERYTLKELLDSKMKAAQTMGRIYVHIADLTDKIKE